MTYRITIIQTGRMELRGPCIYSLSRFDDWEPFIFTMLLVEGAGKTILVNTGLPQDLSILDPFWPMWPGERGLVVTDVERPIPALRRCGIAPENVDHIIVSPLVYYATGNMTAFPNAQISMLKRGWVDFHAPVHRACDAMRTVLIPEDILRDLVTSAWPRVHLLEDEDEVLPGIRTWYAGAHHKSTMTVAIRTTDGIAAYSDCCFKYGNIELNIPIGYLENADEAYSSYARMRREADIVLPAFDPEVFNRHPNGVIGTLEG